MKVNAMRVCLIGVMALAASAIAVRGEEAATKPVEAPKGGAYLTQEQLVQAYREKSYSLVLKETKRILAMPKVAVGYDKFAVTVLCAESLLQLKMFNEAQAAYVAAIADAPNADKAAQIKATVLLLHRRTGMSYVPRTADESGNPLLASKQSGPHRYAIDITDLTKRHAAFRVMYYDQVEGTKAAVAAVKPGAGLESVKQALDSLELLSVLEMASLGEQKDHRDLKQEIAVGAEAALASYISKVKTELKRLNQMMQNQVAQEPRNHGRLTNPADLSNVVTAHLSKQQVASVERAVSQMDAVPKNVKELAQTLGCEVKLFAGDVKEAAETAELGRQVLSAYPEDVTGTDKALHRSGR